ncbi:MAG: hypothetical protein AAF236_14970, partial [Verrucomicrobiota bacterium]
MITTDLCSEFISRHPNSAIQILEHFGTADAAHILTGLPPATRATAIEPMHPNFAASVIGKFSESETAETVAVMGPQSAAALLRKVPSERRKQVLEQLPVDTRKPLELLLRY